METGIDWLQLWRDLVQVTSEQKKTSETKHGERKTNRRWAKRDSTIDFISSRLSAASNATMLDIGAGTGKLAIEFAKHVQRITAIDSSPVMIEKMRENLRDASVTNIHIVEGTWPLVQVEPHDFALCSHGMYGSADFYAFVQKMIGATRCTCFMLIRATTPNGIMAEAAQHIWGHPYDSPNFQVAYNALMQMGIFPNVMMAETGLWDPWVSSSFEEAFAEIKSRFGLDSNAQHDDFLIKLLRERLVFANGEYVWTPSIRSALIYWDVD